MEWVFSYLTVTSSVNLSTRCVRMLRGMVLTPSCLWGGLLFRHAGRVELYAKAPPNTRWGKTQVQRKAKEKEMTHATDRNKQRLNKYSGMNTSMKRSRLFANDQERQRSNIHIMVKHKIWFPSQLIDSQFTL